MKGPYGMQDAQNWVIEETKTADFGDQRLNKRYGNLLASFASAPTKSIPGSFKSWKETIAAYRFFNHEDMTYTEILEPHTQATLERIKNEKTVLIPQDTTEIDFTGRKNISGMGYLSHENSHGLYLHASLAITPERSCLGVIDMQIQTRQMLGISKQRNNKPVEEKESACWLKGYEKANAIAKACPNSIVVSIADREGDMYELLTKMPSESHKAYWLIRSQYNRSILNEADETVSLRLREGLRASKSIGEIEFNMPVGKIYNGSSWKRKPRTERAVRQEVRACTVYLKPPIRKKKLNSIAINVVHCREINPPSEEERIEWFLLTSFPVNSAETALEIVKWYLCRWQIEVFFKILKSGCTVEELQFETLKAVTNCLAMYLIVAWRILYLTMLGRHCPDMACSAVFEENEWHSVYAIVTKKPPPKEPPKLSEMVIMIAKLGGFLGRKSDGYPGSQAMWIGMQRMKDFTLAWETFRGMEGRTYV